MFRHVQYVAFRLLHGGILIFCAVPVAALAESPQEVIAAGGPIEWGAPLSATSGVFMALSAFCVVIAVGMTRRARDERRRRREQLELHERMVRRERIACELHDTLLQSTHGLLLKVQAAAMAIRPGEPAGTLLEAAMADADRLIVESRDRIQALRDAAADPVGLEADLRAHGRGLSLASRCRFELSLTGEARLLQPAAAEEVWRVGREAILNAVRHAHASCIEVELIYGVDEFQLRVRDDGSGLNPHVLGEGPALGRWGLRGMRGRAARVGARIEIWSAPGAGTEVEFSMPAAAVYDRVLTRTWHPRWLRRRAAPAPA